MNKFGKSGQANLDAENIERSEIRAVFYHLLAVCFSQPSESLVNSILNGTLVQSMQLVADLEKDAKLDHALKEIDAFRSDNQGRDASEVLMDMKVAYSRLFVGPGHVEAAPYESVYYSKDSDNPDGLVMGKAAVDAKHRYLAAGIQLQDDFHDLPDHIAVELEFMANLCSRENQKPVSENGVVLDSLAEMEADFLDQHLALWIPLFADQVCLAGRSDFYCAVARLTQAWVNKEWKEIQRGE